WVAKLKEFVQTRYAAELVAAANAHKSLPIDCTLLEMRHPELTALLRQDPPALFAIAEEAMKGVDLVDVEGNPVVVRLRFMSLPELTSVRDLRARHLGQFISTEGVVRRASEIRPEIKARTWQCPECEAKILMESIGAFAPKPFECPGNGIEPCGNRKSFKEVEKLMVDTRMITIEEPFELAEGDRPSQVAVALREDLVDTDGRRITEAGSRLRITGVLKEVPKDKFSSTKLDFFVEANHAQPTEVGWERVAISPEDEAMIRHLASQPDIYEQLIASMAPSLYGLQDVKESIIMQLFGGVPRTLKDKTKFRGDIHILLLGDPASGKCVTGDTLVALADGSLAPIRDIVESKVLDKTIDDGVYGTGSEQIFSLDPVSGASVIREADVFWKRRSPEFLYEVETVAGRKITVTPTHPFFLFGPAGTSTKQAQDLKANDILAVAVE
ncbi:MAG TPA: hypothetical protein VJB16_06400, partial [archaeon]|nr:hypothetical protein [archaeon]